MLSDFQLSDKPVSEDRWFPLPDVPTGWRPDPRRVWASDKENVQPPEPRPQAPIPYGKWKESGKTADERGNLLGETPLPAAPRSVFDFMSKKDRERLQKIAAGVHEKPPATEIAYPQLDGHIAHAALKGYQPFAADPAKHARYVVYLESQADASGQAPHLQAQSGQSVSAFNKELEDYAKAAAMFKPMSDAMAGRFTTAAHVEQAKNVPEGLIFIKAEPDAVDMTKETAEESKTEEELSPKAQAARVGMFGALTREVKPWRPDRLLCKRFGVKEPELHASETDQSTQKTAADTYTKTDLEVAVAAERAHAEQERAAAGNGPRDLANVGLGEDETQGRDTLTYERPAMDVFKAIFASDDEDSGDEGENEMEVDDPPPASAPVVAAVESQTKAEMPEVVDMTTFKPTFVPREARMTKESSAVKPKKDKKKKEKRALVSFAEDEEGGGLTLAPVKKRKGKEKEKDGERSKKKRRHDQDVDDDAMWVEKPAPEAAKAFQDLPSATQSKREVSIEHQDPELVSTSRSSTRKRAIDFL